MSKAQWQQDLEPAVELLRGAAMTRSLNAQMLESPEFPGGPDPDRARKWKAEAASYRLAVAILMQHEDEEQEEGEEYDQ